MITLKDVAKEAGLNFRSVSRVLHKDDPRYSQATRQKIREVADRLGYRPNEIARAMKKGITHSIGVSGYFNSSAVNMEILHITARELHRMGSKMFFMAHESGDANEEKAGIEDLLARRVEGMLIFPDGPDCDTAYYESLWERGTPLVVTGRFSAPRNLPIVSVDVVGGMYAATKHMIALGHRHIAYPVGTFGLAYPGHRFEGYKRALEEAGIPLRREWLMEDTVNNCDSIREFIQKAMQTSPRPTVIMFSNDKLAFIGMNTLQAMGWRVPEDVSVVGFDDDTLAEEMARPQLTTVRLPREELVKEALTLLTQQIQGHPRIPTQVTLTPQMIIRQSTGPAGQAKE